MELTPEEGEEEVTTAVAVVALIILVLLPLQEEEVAVEVPAWFLPELHAMPESTPVMVM